MRVLMPNLIAFSFALLLAPAAQVSGSSPDDGTTVLDYRLLATKKTSTMEQELNEAAAAGYRFRDVMGGETGFGGSEVVVVMSKDSAEAAEPRYQYKLLATKRTSTMQKELQDAGDAGYRVVGQTVFSTAFGGDEVVILLERDGREPERSYDYKLLATSKTSTMQEELQDAGAEGFDLVDLTVSKTAFGGAEIVTILRRARPE